QQSRLDRVLAPARDGSGPDAYEAEWTQGAAMPLVEIIEDALASPVGTQLAEGPVSRNQDAPGADGVLAALTPREREVASLLARGLTNRQIADQLVISERTAEAHVANVLGKLGLDSRAPVVVWFADQV